jgi:glycine dehydrogenase subunit 2
VLFRSPTETESKEELDAFVEAMIAIRHEAQSEPDKLKGAPWTLPVRRLDDVRAAKQLDLTWKAA